jgi:hypothetical protein
VLSFGCSAVSAATVTACGPNICYEYDDAQAAVALFGLPSLDDDSLVFISPSFRAESSNGEGEVDASAAFVIDRVYSISGDAVTVVSLTEFFDYDVVNGDSVSAELTLDVTDNGSLETGGSFSSFSDTGDSGGQQATTLTGLFNPHSNFTGDASDLEVIITDTLTADTDAAGENAWIQKKVTLATTVVPIPAAVWLFGSGLGFLILAGRRRPRTVA